MQVSSQAFVVSAVLYYNIAFHLCMHITVMDYVYTGTVEYNIALIPVMFVGFTSLSVDLLCLATAH